MIAREKLTYQGISFAVHIIVFALVYLLSLAPKLLGITTDTSKIRIVGKAIRVDVVAMPSMTIQELKNYEEPAGEEVPEIAVKPQEKKEELGGDEKVVFEKQVEKPNFADMMKNLSSRDVKKEKNKISPKVESSKKSGAGGISADHAKKILALGNQLAQGTSLYGQSGANANDLFDKYALGVMEKVRGLWTLPGYLAGKDFRCQVQVFISSEGKLIKAVLINSSSNNDYDERAIAAIKRVVQFELPDSAIAARVSAGQIALAFPL